MDSDSAEVIHLDGKVTDTLQASCSFVGLLCVRGILLAFILLAALHPFAT